MQAFVKSRRAQSNEDYKTWVAAGVSPTLNAFDNAHETRATVIAFSHTQGLDPQASPNVFPTLRTEGGGHAVMEVMAFRSTGGAWGVDEGITSPTLTVGSGVGIPSPPAVATPSVVRRLTPTEVERLQGFPDGWTAGQADSHRYRQMGNAVTVNVANFVAWCFNHNAGGAV